MKLETRTRWIFVSELTTDHDIAGFGPVERIVRTDTIIRVTSASGATRAYSAAGDVELYVGVFDETGRRVSMPTEAYKASIQEAQACR